MLNKMDAIENIEKQYPKIKIFYDERKLDSKGSTILDLSKQSINLVRQGDGNIIQ